MSERQARKQNRPVRIAKLPMNAVVRAIETGETSGFMKAVGCLMEPSASWATALHAHSS